MLKISLLKNAYSPELYFYRHLKGTFGNPSGNSWYKWKGLCPFHNDRKAGSFFVNRSTGAFKCFSCGARGGDIVDFHTQFYRIGFSEAVNQLGREIGCR